MSARPGMGACPGVRAVVRVRANVTVRMITSPPPGPIDTHVCVDIARVW